MKITSHLNSIVELVRENDTTLVKANTGTGKSIMIPGTIAERMKMKVFVSVPRVTSSTTLSTFAQKVFPNIRVGYGAEGNKRYDMFTDVVYGTSGHIRRKMYSYVSDGKFIDITFCDLLIIDEMHTLSVDNDAVMSMLMEANEQGKKIPKVMFLSATPVENFYLPKPIVYNIDIPHPYPIEVIYHGVTNMSPSDSENTYKEIVRVASKLSKDDGDVLIFVHGKRAAEDVVGQLTRVFPDDIVLTAYSGMKSEDFDLIYQKTSERKIIVATNVVESSITIDGLGVVIDSLLENQPSTSATGGLKLTVSHISKDSARQRLGRTGRTRKGKCIRMMSSMGYTNLDEHITPEIDRVPINELVMEFVSKGLNPETTLRGINKYKVRDSIKLLTELEGISDGKVTDLGHFLPTVPLGVRNGAFLYHWVQRGYPIFPGIVVAAILDGYQSPGYFYIPRKDANEDSNVYQERLLDFIYDKIEPFKGETQLHTFLNLWDNFAHFFKRDLYKIVQGGNFYGQNRMMFNKWGNKYSVNQKKFKELLTIIRQIYSNVGPIKGTGNKKIGLFNVRNASATALEIIPLCYSGNLIKLEYGHTYTHVSSHTSHILETRNVFSQMEEGDYPREIFAISTVQVRNKIIVSLALPYYKEKDENEKDPLRGEESREEDSGSDEKESDDMDRKGSY
jgi:HrpA-like RNA helicase